MGDRLGHGVGARIPTRLPVANSAGIWVIDTLGAVVEHSDFAAIGTGAEVATGALFYLRSMLTSSRVKYAVEAAIRYAVGCGGEAIVHAA